MTEMKLNALGGDEAFDLMQKNVLGPMKELIGGPMTEQRQALDNMNGSNRRPKAFRAAAREDQIVSPDAANPQADVAVG
jgi:hypothetical protein